MKLIHLYVCQVDVWETSMLPKHKSFSWHLLEEPRSISFTLLWCKIGLCLRYGGLRGSNEAACGWDSYIQLQWWDMVECPTTHSHRLRQLWQRTGWRCQNGNVTLRPQMQTPCQVCRLHQSLGKWTEERVHGGFFFSSSLAFSNCDCCTIKGHYDATWAPASLIAWSHF